MRTLPPVKEARVSAATFCATADSNGSVRTLGLTAPLLRAVCACSPPLLSLVEALLVKGERQVELDEIQVNSFPGSAAASSEGCLRLDVNRASRPASSTAAPSDPSQAILALNTRGLSETQGLSFGVTPSVPCTCRVLVDATLQISGPISTELNVQRRPCHDCPRAPPVQASADIETIASRLFISVNREAQRTHAALPAPFGAPGGSNP